MESEEEIDERRRVRGPVRTLTASASLRVLVDGEWEEQRLGGPTEWTRVFDAEGRTLEEPGDGYVEPGDPARYVYSYDDAGRRVGSDGFDDDGAHIERVDVAYPPDGGAVHSVFYTGGATAEPSLTSRRWYDPAGRLVELRDYRADGAVYSRTLWVAERDGATLVEKTYRFGENREGWWRREMPRVTTQDPEFGEGVLRDVRVRSFDGEGRRVDERLSLPDGMIWSRTVDAYGPGEAGARYRCDYDPETGRLRRIELEFRDEHGETVEELVVDGEAEIALVGEDGREEPLDGYRASFDGVAAMRISYVGEGQARVDEYRRGELGLFERVSTRAIDPPGPAEARSDRGGPLNYHRRVRYSARDDFGNWTIAEEDFRNVGYWSRLSRRRTITYF